MQNICPISLNRIDENVARLNGLFTTTFSVVYILVGWKIIPLLMFADFFIRGFDEARYSLLSKTSRAISTGLQLKTKMINAGPKIFAAQVGTLLTAVAVLAHYFDYPPLAMGAIGMLGFFSFLEGAFGLCVACKIYPFLRKFNPGVFDPGL